MTLSEIKAPIKEHLTDFEKSFRESMKSKVPLLNIITRYILKRKGKQMRPMFVFLAAGISGGITEKTYRAASLIELLHTATLIHDDVVDNSFQRRGFFSLNALWQNKIAVLVGDYLLSRGLLLAVDHNDFDLLKIVSRATQEMSEGELLQIEKARKLDINEEIYFEIIRKKTATLIGSCCASGAQSNGNDQETIDMMYELGEDIGIAFQIRDDLLDFMQSKDTGKPNGIDIRERKMTLPLIYSLNNSDPKLKRQTIRNVKRHNEKSEKVMEVIDTVHQKGGIDYARGKMQEYRDKALETVAQFPASEYRDSLTQLIEFSINRKF